MKTKLLIAFAASFLSMTAFSQKKKPQQQVQQSEKKEEMAVYAEKKGNDYYLVRLEKDKAIPNVYVYSNGVTKPYKTYTSERSAEVTFPIKN